MPFSTLLYHKYMYKSTATSFGTETCACLDTSRRRTLSAFCDGRINALGTFRILFVFMPLIFSAGNFFPAFFLFVRETNLQCQPLYLYRSVHIRYYFKIPLSHFCISTKRHPFGWRFCQGFCSFRAILPRPAPCKQTCRSSVG